MPRAMRPKHAQSDMEQERGIDLNKAKVSEKELETARGTRMLDLAEALKRSVEAAKKSAQPKAPARTRARPARTRRTRKVG